MTLARAVGRVGLAVTAVLAAGCGVHDAAATSRPPSVVEPCTIEGRIVLRGQLEAAAADSFVVPRTPAWSLPIRWMVGDGDDVVAGAPVVDFDAGATTQERLRFEERYVEQQSRRDAFAAKVELERAERASALARAEAEVEKAVLRAAVGEGLLSARELAERKLQQTKAEAALREVRAANDQQEQAAALEAQALEHERRADLRRIEAVIATESAMTMRAGRNGVFVVGRHGWEGRKIAVGDALQPGMVVGTLPHDGPMRVDAALFDVDDGTVSVGDAATIVLDAIPDRRFDARVDSVGPIAQEWPDRRRAFSVRLTLAEQDPSFRPGNAARVEIPRAPVAAARCIDRGALVFGGESVQTTTGTTVDIGPCDAHRCELRDGLALGAEVRWP